MKCGTPNNDTAKFCIKCGQSLAIARPQAAGTRSTSTTPSPLPQYPRPEDDVPTPRPISHQHSAPKANNVPTSRLISRRRSPPSLDGFGDRRANTAWPYVAAVLSIVAGIVLAAVAYIQIDSGDDITMIIGYWNAFVTLAYAWLAIRLVLRQEGAYKMGLSLSLGNVGFVMAQGMFWSIAEDFGVYVGEDLLIVLVSFLATDLLLYGGLLLSFRALVPPMLVESVPDSSALNAELGQKPGFTREERDQLVNIRRRFIVFMHEKLRGSIEINDLHGGQHVDLVAKPMMSYLGTIFGGDGPQRYSFHPIVDREMVKTAKGLIDFMITIAVSEEALRESTRGLSKVGIYVLRGRFRCRKKPSDFDKFASKDLDFEFLWRSY